MPPKKSKSKKRKNKRSKSKNFKYSMTKSLRSPVANSAMLKLRYVTDITLNPAAGIAANHVFRANGLYDPDMTGVGHQPLGFDQWVAFYNKWAVLSSKITVTFSSAVTNDQTIADYSLVGIAARDTDTAITNTSQLREQGDCVWKNLSPCEGSRSIVKVTKAMSMKRYYHAKIVGDELYTGTSAADPTEQLYYHVWSSCIDSATDASLIYANVTIEYIAVFTDPQDLSQS